MPISMSDLVSLPGFVISGPHHFACMSVVAIGGTDHASNNNMRHLHEYQPGLSFFGIHMSICKLLFYDTRM
jgi:hypothetical protein